ncbi:MAG: response regulator transcription factor [Myxococcaceae bacterium]
MIRVVIADDHEVVRQGVKAVLQHDAGIQVVGEAADGLEAVDVVTRLMPDVLVLDLSMPGLNGRDCIPQVKSVSPRTHVLVLSMHTTPEYVRLALRAGALGYVVKGSGVNTLPRAVQTVAAGHRFLDPKAEEVVVRDEVEGSDSTDDIERLTAREREVLQLVAEGATNREMGARLGVSHKTIDRFRTSLMRKLDLHSAQALTRFAIRKGLISDE